MTRFSEISPLWLKSLSINALFRISRNCEPTLAKSSFIFVKTAKY